MRTLSYTDVCIAAAVKSGKLQMLGREGRFGSFVSIEDDKGIIEVQANWEDAQQRVADVKKRMGIG